MAFAKLKELFEQPRNEAETPYGIASGNRSIASFLTNAKTTFIMPDTLRYDRKSL